MAGFFLSICFSDEEDGGPARGGWSPHGGASYTRLSTDLGRYADGPGRTAGMELGLWGGSRSGKPGGGVAFRLTDFAEA